MSKIYKPKLVFSTGEELKDVVRKNFSIYRKKYEYSPIFLISKEQEIFEIGYFDNDSTNCIHKKSDVTIKDIKSIHSEFVEINNFDIIEDFHMGIYNFVQDKLLKQVYQQ